MGWGGPVAMGFGPKFRKLISTLSRLEVDDIEDKAGSTAREGWGDADDVATVSLRK